jgi:2-keto-4-pentenoate hydratase/2-oxohepta-3-ene-1,7-dioic acid hydratase in catechol pathway
MRLLRFRFGDRIATGASDYGSDTARVLRGTFFEDPIPTGEEVSLDDVRLLAPVIPSKLVCVGKNYAAHAAEFGMTVPDEPLLFLKPSSSDRAIRSTCCRSVTASTTRASSPP